jgi:hypothetical protein
MTRERWLNRVGWGRTFFKISKKLQMDQLDKGVHSLKCVFLNLTSKLALKSRL